MKIYNLQLGELGANCYIIETEPGRCVAVDIGGDWQILLDFLKSKKLSLSKILLTHGHFDHIGGAAEAAASTGAEIYVHSDDAYMLGSKKASLAEGISRREFISITEFISVYGDSYISDGERIFKVLHTPGHSPGSVCYICEDVIFSGDTLFCGSIGRTDFPGSNPRAMRDSLKTLNQLNGNYRVLPGHNNSTTLDNERRCNPYLIKA